MATNPGSKPPPLEAQWLSGSTDCPDPYGLASLIRTIHYMMVQGTYHNCVLRKAEIQAEKLFEQK